MIKQTKLFLSLKNPIKQTILCNTFRSDLNRVDDVLQSMYVKQLNRASERKVRQEAMVCKKPFIMAYQSVSLRPCQHDMYAVRIIYDRDDLIFNKQHTNGNQYMDTWRNQNQQMHHHRLESLFSSPITLMPI